METFREMLTLGRIRGMYNKNKFVSLSEQELCDVRDWLYVHLCEIQALARDVSRALLQV